MYGHIKHNGDYTQTQLSQCTKWTSKPFCFTILFVFHFIPVMWVLIAYFLKNGETEV